MIGSGLIGEWINMANEKEMNRWKTYAFISLAAIVAITAVSSGVIHPWIAENHWLNKDDFPILRAIENQSSNWRNHCL
jgi:hypothetical protein